MAGRSNLSKKSKYYISKERKLELVHFCRQYKDWIREKKDIYFAYPIIDPGNPVNHDRYSCDSKVEKAIERLEELDWKISIVENACSATDAYLSNYILYAVTTGASYETLEAKYEIPYAKNTFYDRCREFWYLLSLVRS